MQNRVFARNFLSLATLQILGFAIPVIMLPFLARSLSPQQFGVYSIIQSVLIIGNVISDYGYLTNGTRMVSLATDQHGRLREILTRALSTRLAISFLVSAISFACLHFVIREFFSFEVFFIVFASSTLSALNLLWFFQGINRVVIFTWITFAGRIVSLIAVVIFVRSSNDTLIALWLNIIPTALASLCGIYFIYTYYSWRPAIIGGKELVMEIREGWSFFLPTLLSIFLTNSGIVFLGIYSSPTVVGSYSAIERLVKAIASLNGPINQLVYPQVASKIADSRPEGERLIIRYSKVFLPISFVGSLLLAFFGNNLIRLFFGERYLAFADTIYYLPVYVFLSTVNTFVGVVYLTTIGKQKFYGLVFAMGTLVALVFFIFLTPIISYHAAAMGIVLGELTMTIAIIFHITRNRKVKSNV